MPADGYRLWQAWQQMHYPVRGLPVTDSARSDLAALDGGLGQSSSANFVDARRLPCSKRIHGPSSKSVSANRMNDNLSDDAARYFDRVQLLVNFLLTSEAATRRKPLLT